MIQRVICNFDLPAEALCVWIILACDLALCVHKPVHCYVFVQFSKRMMSSSFSTMTLSLVVPARTDHAWDSGDCY